MPFTKLTWALAGSIVQNEMFAVLLRLLCGNAAEEDINVLLEEIVADGAVLVEVLAHRLGELRVRSSQCASIDVL